MNYITQETAQLIEACKALSDYVHAEQSSTDGQVTYSTSTINHHVFQIRAALAQPAKPVRIMEEQPPSGTLTNPEVARSALKAVFSDIPDYFKTAKERT
jgi:hypothetical protein